MMKRAYLKEEIINHGFNPQDFVDFCETGRGADIDIYTLAQLQDIVEEFKKKQAELAAIPEEETVPENCSPDRKQSINPFDAAASQEEEMAHALRRERHSLLFDETTMTEVRRSKDSEHKSELEPVPELAADEAHHEDHCAVADVVEVPELSKEPEPPKDAEPLKDPSRAVVVRSLLSSPHRSPDLSLKFSLASKHSPLEDTEYVDSSYTIQVQPLPDTELSMVRQPRVLISE